MIPICTAFGSTAAANWLGTAFGMSVVVLLILLLQWALAVFGVRFFRMAQSYVLIPFVVIGMVTMIVVLALHWGTDFRAAFDAYNAGTGITYHSVQAAAVKNGYVPTGFSSAQHPHVVRRPRQPIIPFTMFAAQGNIGIRASNLRRLFMAFLLPGVFMAFGVLFIPWVMMEHVVGTQFLNQFATAPHQGRRWCCATSTSSWR